MKKLISFISALFIAVGLWFKKLFKSSSNGNWIVVKAYDECKKQSLVYAKDGDAGIDLVSTDCAYSDGYFVYHTGLHLEIPKGYVGLIFPRSSNRNTNAYMTNHVGVIDSSYRGEILICFKNRNSTDRKPPYEVGNKVAQLIIMPYPLVSFFKMPNLNDLSTTDRGSNGHGSTGK